MYRETDLPAPYDCDATARLKHPVIDTMRQFWDYADYFDCERESIGLKNYYALCSFLDSNVAQVLAALERSGQAGNTQIIYTSDHGEMTGKHVIWGRCFMEADSFGSPMS